MKRDFVSNHYHQKFQNISDNSGDIKLCRADKVRTRACFLLLQVSATQSQLTRLRALFYRKKRDFVCFPYHHKCQYFTDNSGDNKIGLVVKVRTRCMLPNTSSVINSMSMNLIWNFLASSETRLCMHSLFLKFQNITDNSDDKKLGLVE